MKINEDVICILEHKHGSNQIEIGFEPINKELESDFNEITNVFEDNRYEAKDIIQIIANHKQLSVLFTTYDFCDNLSGSFQGFYTTIEQNIAKYDIDFQSIKELEEREKFKANQKKNLLADCQKRLLAFQLKKAYNKCAQNPKILAYSHRKTGWAAPKYILNNSFSFEFKSNFGYGSSSYFYTKINYKGLDIVPFSDWVNYRISQIYEIVLYSTKHQLSNQSWQMAMGFVCDAYNLSISSEEMFVQKYILDQFNSMIIGLTKILTQTQYVFKGYTFFDQSKSYIDYKLTGHNLNEFRGEKITGALNFIPVIEEYCNIMEVNKLITKIESLNTAVLPKLKSEERNLRMELNNLRRETTVLKTKLDKLNARDLVYNQKIENLKKILEKQTIVFKYHHEYVAEFKKDNPDYERFITEFCDVSGDYNIKVMEILRLENILDNILKYQLAINQYFKAK